MSDTTTPITSLSEIVERAEKTEKSAGKRTQKDNLRFLNTDNTWNRAGILAAFDETEDEMTYCAASGVPLFYISRDGRKYVIESHGYCVENGKPYHRDYLKMSDDVGRSSYPVIYLGCYSLEEYEKPLSPEVLAEIRKEYGI